MCVYIHIYIYIHIYTYIQTYRQTDMHTRMHAHMRILDTCVTCQSQARASRSRTPRSGPACQTSTRRRPRPTRPTPPSSALPRAPTRCSHAPPWRRRRRTGCLKSRRFSPWPVSSRTARARRLMCLSSRTGCRAPTSRPFPGPCCPCCRCPPFPTGMPHFRLAV